MTVPPEMERLGELTADDYATMRENAADQLRGDVGQDIAYLTAALLPLDERFDEDVSFDGRYEAFHPLGDAYVDPVGLNEYPDQPESLDTQDDYYVDGWIRSFNKQREGDTTFMYPNEKKDHIDFMLSYYTGENVFKDSTGIAIRDSRIEGENALKLSESLELVDSWVKGEHVLDTSEDLTLADTVVYGDQSLGHTDQFQVRDSFVLGQNPFNHQHDDRENRILNSVIVGYAPFRNCENATLYGSLVAGVEPAANTEIGLDHSYVLTDGELQYFEQGTFPTDEPDSSIDLPEGW